MAKIETLRAQLLREYHLDGVHACSGALEFALCDYWMMAIDYDSHCGQQIFRLTQVAWQMDCLIDSSHKDVLWNLVIHVAKTSYYG